MISDDALREFKQIWKDEFDTEIPDDVAVAEAVNLLTMFDTVYRPLRQADVDEYEKSRCVFLEK